MNTEITLRKPNIMSHTIYDFTKDKFAWYADEIIRDTNRNVFLTGKAGTGKSELLKFIIKTIHKNFIVLAPTGAAAVNIGGSTFHNFLGLPNSIFDINNNSKIGNKISKQSKEVIKSLEILFVDEVSMVRADLIDATDHIFKKIRGCNLPFGGVQIVLVGDLYQLPPVVMSNDKFDLLKNYESEFFFDSMVFKKIDIIKIGLKKVYRQSDSGFVELLDRVRTNNITCADVESLNKRANIKIPFSNLPLLTLTTKNCIAELINERELKKLYGECYTFKPIVKGEWKGEKPFEDTLRLKEGAKVIFTKNYYAGTYYNGMMGTVKRIDEKQGILIVTEDNEFWVDRVNWKYQEFCLKDNKIIRVNRGEYLQYPLKLGFAITIHKSQGLTLERVHIDLGTGTFASGQLYVALSRCKSLDGIFLSSIIRDRDFKANSKVKRFLEDINDYKLKAALSEIV